MIFSNLTREEKRQKDYEETLELSKSFNKGFLKGVVMVAGMDSLTGGFSEW